MGSGLGEWIAEGEKYALVVMEVKLGDAVTSRQLSPHLWALAEAQFKVPEDWPEWLGSIRTEELSGSNFFLLAKQPSKTPDVIDSESQDLQRQAWRFYTGLLVATMFSPAHAPAMLGGARRSGMIGVREKWTSIYLSPKLICRTRKSTNTQYRWRRCSRSTST